MDLLRNPEDLHLNTFSLKPSDKTKQKKKPMLQESIWETVYMREGSINSNVVRATNLRTCVLYDYYPSNNQSISPFCFFKVMLMPFQRDCLEKPSIFHSTYTMKAYTWSSLQQVKSKGRTDIRNQLCYKSDCINVLMGAHGKYLGEGEINSGLKVREGFMK